MVTSDRMAEEEIAAIEARAEAATPGPWERQPSLSLDARADAAFVAAAREDVPRLLAALRAERARADRAEAIAKAERALRKAVTEPKRGAWWRAADDAENDLRAQGVEP